MFTPWHHAMPTPCSTATMASTLQLTVHAMCDCCCWEDEEEEEEEERVHAVEIFAARWNLKSLRTFSSLLDFLPPSMHSHERVAVMFLYLKKME